MKLFDAKLLKMAKEQNRRFEKVLRKGIERRVRMASKKITVARSAEGL